MNKFNPIGLAFWPFKRIIIMICMLLPFQVLAQFPDTLLIDNLTDDLGYRIIGDNRDIRGIGDINGDGFDDYIVSSFRSIAYVFFGNASGFPQNTSFGNLDGTNGFAIDGSTLGSGRTVAIASSGDVNGDNLDDILIGVTDVNSANASNGGSAFVIFGSMANFDATYTPDNLDGTNGFVMEGAVVGDQLGTNVEIIGDLDNDGLDEIMVSAPFASPNDLRDAGAIYFIYGRTQYPPSFQSNQIGGGLGFTINGDRENERLGRFDLVKLGDMNNDDIEDAAFNTVDATGSQIIQVMFGQGTEIRGEIDKNDLIGDRGFMVIGNMSMSGRDSSFDGIGDFNGDGIADLAISQIGRTTPTIPVNEQIHIIYGNTEGFDDAIELDDLDGINGFTMRIPAFPLGLDLFNRMNPVGDINGDGLNDLSLSRFIPTRLSDINIEDVGIIILLGQLGGYSESILDIPLGDSTRTIVIERPFSSRPTFTSNLETVGIGDINGDGVTDLGISNRGRDDILIIYGQATMGRPTVQNPIANQLLIAGFGATNINLTDIFNEPDGQPLTFSATVSNSAIVSSAIEENTLILNELGRGIANVTVTATDPDGLLAIAVFTVTVDGAPIIREEISSQLINLPNSTISLELSQFFRDFNGGINYRVTGANNEITTARILSGDVLEISSEVIDSSPEGPLVANLTVTAIDMDSNETDQTFEVRVNRPVSLADDIINNFGTINLGADTVIDLRTVFEDPDLDNLTFTVNSETESQNPVNSFVVEDGILTISSLSIGSETFTLSAVDGLNPEATEFEFLLLTNGVPVANPPLSDLRIATGFESFTINLQNNFTDPEDAILNYTVTSSVDSVGGFNLVDSILTITEMSTGFTDVVVTASDRLGATFINEFEFNVFTVDNEAPVLETSLVERNLVEGFEADTINLNLFFTDPEGSRLIYRAESELNSVVTTTLVDSLLILSEEGLGITTIDVVAFDGLGERVFGSFNVNISPNDALYPIVFDVSDLNGNNGFVINGPSSGFGINLGNSARRTGDINNDGIDDFLLGTSNLSFSVALYAVYGQNRGFSPIVNIDETNVDNSVRFLFEQTSSRPFSDVGTTGDLNGDDIEDFVLATGIEGQTFIVFGRADGYGEEGVLSVEQQTNGVSGFIFQVNGSDNLSEAHIIGDVNNDGLDDALIASSGGQTRGYVIFGSRLAYPNPIQASQLNGNNGFKLFDGIESRFTGPSRASGIDDINGDGINDFVISNVAGMGRVFVIYGRSEGFPANFDLNSLDGTNGYVINGVREEVALGFTVDDAGDFNGDGLSDLIIGESIDNARVTSNAYVIYGSTVPQTASINLNTLNGENGFAILDDDRLARTAISVSGIGDFNGDGIDDIGIGADRASFVGFEQVGAAYILYGNNNSESPASVRLNQLNGQNGFVIRGVNRESIFGSAIENIGDVNNDGSEDILISAPVTNLNSNPALLEGRRNGRNYVIYGRSANGPLINQEISNTLVNEGFESQIFDLGELFTIPDEQEVNYNVTLSTDSVITTSIMANELTFTEVGSGSTEIVIEAEVNGLKAFNRLVFEVNRLPITSDFFEDSLFSGQVQKINDTLVFQESRNNTLFFGTSRLFSDPDGDPLSFRVFTSFPDSIVSARVDTNRNRFLVSPLDSAIGLGNMTFIAEDRGGITETSIGIKLNVNPDLIGILNDTVSVLEGFENYSVNLDTLFNDLNGDSLLYQFNSEGGPSIISDSAVYIQDNILIFSEEGFQRYRESTGINRLNFNTTVVAEDGFGGRVQESVRFIFNRAPEISNLNGIRLSSGFDSFTNFIGIRDDFLTDDELTINVESRNPEVVMAALTEEDRGILITEVGRGKSEIVITVSDGFNVAIDSFLIAVDEALVTSISDDLPDLSIFPNPTKGQFKVTFGRIIEKGIVRLISLEGRELMNARVNGEEEITLTIDEPKGIYLMVLDREGLQRIVFKVFKE